MSKTRAPLQVPAAVTGCQGPCWRPSGLFPDPVDCCGFFSCASCRAYRLRCAPGTVFDRRLGLCNHPHDAPACLAPNPGTPAHQGECPHDAAARRMRHNL
ncbi:hypothetical protein MTO96_018342 [Rhipicephalus appendiculatus]